MKDVSSVTANVQLASTRDAFYSILESSTRLKKLF